ALATVASQAGVALGAARPALCTDNAAMFAGAGAERLPHGLCDALDTPPGARWPLDQVGKPLHTDPGTAGVSPAIACPPAGQTGGRDARGPGEPADSVSPRTAPPVVA